MMRILRSLALGAFLVGSGFAPAVAATNQAVLNVSATVTNNCDVLTQPATLTMSYNPVQNIATPGTSSFTYACTNGASVSVTPTSPNVGSGHSWLGWNSGHTNNLGYFLYDDLACSTNQLTNGQSESLGTGTGSTQTYNICAAVITGQTSAFAFTYNDTVTFTFNFAP